MNQWSLFFIFYKNNFWNLFREALCCGMVLRQKACAKCMWKIEAFIWAHGKHLCTGLHAHFRSLTSWLFVVQEEFIKVYWELHTINIYGQQNKRV